MVPYQKKKLSQEQLEIVQKVLEENKETILTRKITKILEEKFGLSELAIMRRAKTAGMTLLNGYSWDEYWQRTDIHFKSHKKYLSFECENCNAKNILKISNFENREERLPLCIGTKERNWCDGCYSIHSRATERFKKNNSAAQLIAQNRPEVLQKQREAQLKRYAAGGTLVLEQYREIGKKLWQDEGYRKNQIDKMKQNWQDPEYRKKIMSGYRQYTGIYEGCRYYSLVELSFLLNCFAEKRPVKNYDGRGIAYEFEGKERRYYPDFMIYDDWSCIVEVKGSGSWYKRDKKLVEKKFEALKDYCENNDLTCRLVFDSDLGKELWQKAKRVHNEISQQAHDTI
jgi:hypothetical protein